ncbi:hypothetical protein [Staphylococcus saprophyticus]|uniref:hypothetical protein n=1 Tax=Staphylococcus saprophyticus TaxID=29385 RepID=UPI0021B1F0EC|nr:hypothetical protein [Staphylococcus saprophyticus]
MKNSINQLFNYHFEKDTQDKNNTVGSVIKLKGLDYGATPEQSDLAIHFKSIKKRYSVSMDYFTTEDFVQEYAGLFLFVAQELEVLEDLDYLLANPDVYKQRIRFIKDGIAREMYHVANPDKQRVYTRDGYKYIDNSATSLDNPVGQGEDATTLVNLISDENSIFKQTESHHNHFVQYFLDNREHILTKKQLTTFETLKDIYQPKAGNTKEDNAQRQLMLQDANLNNRNMKLIFKRIKGRVTDAYEKEFDGVYHSHSYTDRKELYEVMAEYIESADYPGWNTAQERQRELNGIIQDYYNVYEELELIITKGLSVEDKKEIVRAVKGSEMASNRVLRKINTNIKQAIKEHAPLNIEASYPSFEYQENPFAGLSQLEGNNLMFTATGNITMKDNLQTS